MPWRINNAQLRGVFLGCAVVVLCTVPCLAAGGPVPELSCEAAMVVDAETGAELFSLDPDRQMFPASLTKMMTGFLVADSDELDRVVTITRTAAEVGESGLYLEPDEKVRLRDLLTGTLVWSANDAATAAAEAVAGDVDAFVKRMNLQAAEWGATSTQFRNPHGLHDELHYTTARDLAIIATHAMKQPLFRRTVATKSFRMLRPDYAEPETPERKAQLEPGADRLRTMAMRGYKNRNRLLSRWALCDGIKTGYTRQAGRCLAASATTDGWQAISVVLKSKNCWEDAQNLLEWAFANYSVQQVVRRGQRGWTAPVLDGASAKVELEAGADLRVLMPRSGAKVSLDAAVQTTEAPVAAGAELGRLDVLVDGKSRATVPLVAAHGVGLSLWGQIKHLELPGNLEAILLCLAAGVLLLGATAKTARACRYRVSAGK